MWSVLFGSRSFALGPKALAIGRDEGADLVIDDPAVSRRHATLTLGPAGPLLADAGSHSGVIVNGAKVAGSVLLQHGDRISILEHTIHVVESAGHSREASTIQARKASAAERSTLDAAGIAPDLIGEMLSAAEGALAAGDADGVAEHVVALLDVARRAREQGSRDASLLRRASAWVLRGAARLGRADWIDAVVALHARSGRVMHALTIDALEAALARVPDFDRKSLAEYTIALRPAGAYEAFCTQRLREAQAPRATPGC